MQHGFLVVGLDIEAKHETLAQLQAPDQASHSHLLCLYNSNFLCNTAPGLHPCIAYCLDFRVPWCDDSILLVCCLIHCIFLVEEKKREDFSR